MAEGGRAEEMEGKLVAVGGEIEREEDGIPGEAIAKGKADDSVDGNDQRMIDFKYFKMKESTYVLVLFTLVNLFLFADQNLLAPNLTVISKEFGMTEEERDVYLGGYISLGFFAVGGTISMVIGYAADSLNRKLTFAASVIIGELSCLATYWVPANNLDDFWVGLWVTRAITGVAIGGAIPIQYSIFGDYFSEENRGKVVAFLSVAVGIGAGIGQFLAGLMSPDWRTPFVIVSVPAFFLTAVYVFTTKEPKRGLKEKSLEHVDHDEDTLHTISWGKFKNLFSRPTFLLILLQGLTGIFPWGIQQVFLNDFLIVEKNLTADEAAFVIPAQYVGVGAATILAGIVADRLWKNDRKLAIPILAGTTTIVASFPMMAIVDSPPLSQVAYILLLPPTGFVAGIGGPLMRMLLLNITLPETRGTAFAFLSLVDDLGRGVGPYLVSILIVAAGSRTAGIFIGFIFWIPCGLVMLCIVFTLKKDLEKNEKELQETRARRLSL